VTGIIYFKKGLGLIRSAQMRNDSSGNYNWLPPMAQLISVYVFLNFNTSLQKSR
jgi:hypothetical protein